MKSILHILPIFLLLSCAVQVKTFQNPQANFSEYQTWCWMQGCEVVYQGPEYYNDPRVIDEIAGAIAWNMNDKGYTQGDDKSDMVLNFYIILEQDSSEVSSPFYGTYQGEREWLTMLYPEYQQFLKGSLVIDVLSRKTSELVWTSSSVRYLEINPTFDQKSIWTGIGKAMKKLPKQTD